MSALKLIKKSQISLITTIFLVSLVVVLTLLVNYQWDSQSISKSSVNRIKVTGGSATGNAIKHQLVTNQSDSTNTLRPDKHSGTLTSYSDSAIQSHDFDHLFHQGQVNLKYHYKSQPDTLNYVLTSDTLSADSLKSLIDSLQTGQQALTIGSDSAYGVFISGTLDLNGYHDLTLYGLNFHSEGTSLRLLGSSNINLWGIALQSDSSTALEIIQSEKIHLRELIISQSIQAISIQKTDYSAHQGNHFLKLERSIIHNNKVALSIETAHGVLMRDNFLGYNSQGIIFIQDSPTLLNLPQSILASHNVFYKTPNPTLDSNQAHYFTPDFTQMNIFDDSQEKSQLESLAWFWLAH